MSVMEIGWGGGENARRMIENLETSPFSATTQRRELHYAIYLLWAFVSPLKQVTLSGMVYFSHRTL